MSRSASSPRSVKILQKGFICGHLLKIAATTRVERALNNLKTRVAAMARNSPTLVAPREGQETHERSGTRVGRGLFDELVTEIRMARLLVRLKRLSSLVLPSQADHDLIKNSCPPRAFVPHAAARGPPTGEPRLWRRGLRGRR